MKKIFALCVTAVLLYCLCLSAFARQKQVKNVYFSQHAGSLQANFTTDELVENGDLMIYKDEKTGFTATISIDEESSSDGYYRADVYFEDGKAYTGFSFDFNTVENKIEYAYNFYGRFPFRQLDVDFNKTPRVETHMRATSVTVEFDTTTNHSYVGQYCRIYLYDDGTFDMRRDNMLDINEKGGYDGFTLKMVFYDILGIFPILVIVIPIIVIYYKKKNHKKEENHL